jgi:hypothetical protein
MNILIACEESQVVCKAFRAKGHRAFSADIQECSGGHPEWHIKGDVLPILNGRCEFTLQNGQTDRQTDRWDLIIAHPPCTYLTNAGTRHYSFKCNPPEKVYARMKLREEAAEFFMNFVNADCDKIMIENPVGWMNSQYRKADQIIHPYYFAKSADDKENYYTKRTCLWLKGLEPLCKTSDLPVPPPLYVCQGEKCKGKKIGWCEGIKGTHDGQQGRAKARSKTFSGIAEAMAEQWG